MKKVLSFTLALACVLSLSACGTKAEKVEFNSRPDVGAKLDNYAITVEFTDNRGAKTVMTEKRCAEGCLWQMGDSIQYVEYGTGKLYQLYTNKTGLINRLDSEEKYQSFGNISVYLFYYEPFANLDMKKSGGGKIAGRETTAYSFEYDNKKQKIWIDNELGITMKYTVESGGETVTMEVKEFRAGGITLADMVNLGDYTVTDMS